ncbi:unnamed protein product [Rotaria sp. Silwood1]|nr:unnamed protein product [Rotaria sp. Silwood1]
MRISKYTARTASVRPLDPKIIKNMNELNGFHINFETPNTRIASKSHQGKIKSARTKTSIVRIPRSQLSSCTVHKFRDQQQSPDDVEQPVSDQSVQDNTHVTLSNDVQIDLDHDTQTPLSSKTLPDQIFKHSAVSFVRVHPSKINTSQNDFDSMNARIFSNNSFNRSINSVSTITKRQIVDDQFVFHINEKNNRRSSLNIPTKEKRRRHRRLCGAFCPCCSSCCCLLTGLLLALLLAALAVLIFFLISPKTTTTTQRHPPRPAQRHPPRPAQRHPPRPAQQHPLQPAQQHPLQPAQQHPLQPAQQHQLQPAPQQQRQLKQQLQQQQVNLNS